MADYAISNVPRRVVYAPNGVGPYAFTFEILDQTDIAVYRGDALLTLTTDYTVSINGSTGTGSVTLVTTAGTSNITIVGAKNIQRTTDFTTGGDLFADSLNDELDNQTIFAQQVAETAERALKAPVTDPTDINMTLPTRSSRAGKTLAFDSNGNPIVGEDIGNWRDEWEAGTSYTVRDLVKDSSNSNVYRCNTSHTSSGTTPISTNADSAKWDLVVEVNISGNIVDTSGTQTLTNKTISTDNNTLSGIAASSFVLSNASGNIDGSASQKAIPAGVVVGTTDTQTLSNKTVTNLIMDGYIREEVFAVSGTTPALSPSNGTIQTWSLSGNSTPTQGTWTQGESMTLMIDDGTARTITWTSVPVVWVGGSAPTLATTGFTVIEFWEVGTTIYGALVGNVA